MEQQKNTGTQAVSAVFFDRVARHILTLHSPPDLRRATILLPNQHSAQPLARALASLTKSTLLLPQMITLSDWAQSVTLDQPIQADTQRSAALYQALRERNWFVDADLWSLTSELLALMDDLTRHHVALPASAAEFSKQLALAYQSTHGQALQFEARVVYELWHAMSSGTELDRVSAYQRRLAHLAQQVNTSLYVLLASDLTTSEANFLQACRSRVEVTLFDLREMGQTDAEGASINSSRVLSAALGAGSPDQLQQAQGAAEIERVPQLREQAAQLRENFPAAGLGAGGLGERGLGARGLGARLRLFGAHSLEQEARAADVQVRRWLLAGKQNIAIVAQDRLVARRVRALLERAAVLVQDETGWTFSTLSVSTVVMRWLDVLQSNFYHQDLLDLLKSPFIFADQPADQRKQAVYQLEKLVRKHGVTSHLDAYFDLAQGDPAVQQVLARLRQAAEVLRKTSDSLSGWLGALHDSLSILGVLPGLAADQAGMQLLQAVQNWQQELANDNSRFSRTEWRHWLAQQLGAQPFRDTGIESKVRLTHLAATRWRNFDAVLLLGCDASHLPGTDTDSRWFNDAVRSSLGLPTREVQHAQQRDDLLSLLTLNDTVLVTWQSSKGGEINLLSPYLEMLRAVHDLAYGDDLSETELGTLLEAAQVRSTEFALPALAAMPTPGVPHNLIPARISPSAYNSLVACPYQFYARHVLHLNELDEVPEGVEKRDYGAWVHDILHRFHEQFPLLSTTPRADLEEALQRISNEVFAPIVARDYLARAWLLRWQQAISPYLDQQLHGEAEGWHYQKGEVPFALPLTDALLLQGRIDRVDVQTQTGNSVRVLDYKMIDATRLRNKLKEVGEDVQLACYAHVYEAEVAAYISIEKDKVISVAPAQDVVELAQANIDRLKELFTQMHAGAAMPAHGIEEACVHCEMRGLCRKAEWS